MRSRVQIVGTCVASWTAGGMRIRYKGGPAVSATEQRKERESYTKLPQRQRSRGSNVSGSSVSDTHAARRTIEATYDSEVYTPVRESRRRNRMRIVPRVTDDLTNVNVPLSSPVAELLTITAVTKNKMFVMGGPGQ